MAPALVDVPESWPVGTSRYLHRDDWIVALRSDEVSRPEHPEERFERITVEHPGAVVVLAVDGDERVLCLRQYRHPTQHRFVELVAGVKDAGEEPPVETAARELREEAELVAASWQLLLSTYSSAGLTTEVHDIFLATDLSYAPRGDFQMHAEEADMETLWVPMSDLLDAVLAGDVRQGPLAQAVLAYEVLKHRGGLQPRRLQS